MSAHTDTAPSPLGILRAGLDTLRHEHEAGIILDVLVRARRTEQMVREVETNPARASEAECRRLVIDAFLQAHLRDGRPA